MRQSKLLQQLPIDVPKKISSQHATFSDYYKILADFCFGINVSHFSFVSQKTNLTKSYEHCETLYVANKIFFENQLEVVHAILTEKWTYKL